MAVPRVRVSEAAALLGVSDDTLRRWADAGRIEMRAEGRRLTVDGAELAGLAREIAEESPLAAARPRAGSSARNRIPGIVTRVEKDGVMAQVELQAGPFRIVSLMSREAAEELELEPGRIATASMKATTVVVEAEPARPDRR
ncbi:molybdopterin-binding protein [Naasia sp. SYSU D00057]|uniref:TOBE domain-containing protein n=1 Tax=Naasia sp. SYSU D00057 TaxID=2817380 RepID=UPI001B307F76|nr:TOBE domain-containing protein [Naasia sp. SYSU D00057]